VALRDLNPFVRRESPVSPVLAAAVADLDRLTADRPELAAAGGTLAAVLRAAFAGAVPAGLPHADPELLAAAWRAGVPAFRAGESPPGLDPDDLRARALAVVDVLMDQNPHAKPLRKALRDGSADPHAWAIGSLTERSEAVDEATAVLGLDSPLARSVLRLAVLPQLAARSEAIAALRPEGLWTRGGCPNCGNPPTLAESRGLEQRRHWRCGLCAADWEGHRLRCPFCGESDHGKLRYLFVEGQQDRHRLAVCDSCDGRLRVVSTLRPLSPPGLLVAELATVHLEMCGDGKFD